MTISPPAKVKPYPPAKVKGSVFDEHSILASGIDTLVLAIDVHWKIPRFLDYLANMKQTAQDEDREITVAMEIQDDTSALFNIKRFGTEGYEWILINNEFTLKIGNWKKPKIEGRPSIMVEFRSIVLWHMGTEDAVKKIIGMLEMEKAHVVSIKVSRVDLCVDILLPENEWVKEVADYSVTRSRYQAIHSNNRKMTGISIGKDKISARLYDKPLEIRQQGNVKAWFYEIWGIDPNQSLEGYKIIRVEFQLRRDALKDLAIFTISDLFSKSGELWAYCSQKWLKFQDRPGNHHTMRKTLKWWQAVQAGFEGAQNATPLVREKADRVQAKQLVHQSMGLLTSLRALKDEVYDRDFTAPVSLKDLISTFTYEAQANGIKDEDIETAVFNKRTKYHRHVSSQGEYFRAPEKR